MGLLRSVRVYLITMVCENGPLKVPESIGHVQVTYFFQV